MNKNVDRLSIYKIYSNEAKKQREAMLNDTKKLKNAPHKQVKSR